MPKSFVAVILVSACSGPAALHAQMLTNPVQDFINKTTLLNNILSNRRAIEMSQKAQNGGVSQRPGSKTQAEPDRTAFTYSGSTLMPKQLAVKAGPQAEQYFNSLISLYEQTARKDGFPPHDLAYAMEYFLVNTYMTYHDLHDVEYTKDPRVKRGKDMFERLTIVNEKKLLKVTLPQERAVYQQFKTALSSNAAVASMTDRQKQEVTELLAIGFGVNFKTYLDAVNREDDRAIEVAHQQARTSLEKLTGTPIERIKFTSFGLEK